MGEARKEWKIETTCRECWPSYSGMGAWKMKTRNPKEPVKASNIFKCFCDGEPEFDGVAAMKEHLVDVHKITELRGTKSMVLHLDCADSFHSTFEWEIAGIKFSQFTSSPRHKHDQMRYQE